MSSATVSFALISDTDANFRIWGKAISDQLKTSWTQTSDTGQIDWSTVLKPAAISTVQGYEIFRSNDASGGIVELYFKIEYGSSAGGATAPAIWVTAGWASNGTGSLSGVTSSRHLFNIGGAASGTIVTNNLGVGTGWCALMLGTAASNNFYFSIERTKSSSNADQNEILLIGNQSNGTTVCQVIGQSAAYTVESSGGALIPTAANAVVSGSVGLGLWFGQKGGFTNPSLNILGCATGTLGAPQGTLSITTYGSSHTYIINVTSVNIHRFGGNTSTNVLSRFD